jgi:hypothetical protein
VLPEVTTQFRRHFEDHEFVGPRGEAAFTPELVDPVSNEQYGVGSGLMSQIVQFGPSDLSAGVAASDLATGRSQQKVVEPADRLVSSHVS